jgi:hypothetical protein
MQGEVLDFTITTARVSLWNVGALIHIVRELSIYFQPAMVYSSRKQHVAGSTPWTWLEHAYILCDRFHPSIHTAICDLVDTVFRLLASLSPNGAFDQVLHLARLLVDLGKHEALEERVHSFDLDTPCHARGQLVAITKELLS